MRKGIVFLIGLIWLIAGCTGQNSSEHVAKTSDERKVISVAIGVPGSLDNVSLNVDEIHYDRGSTVVQPKQGDIWLVVDASVENKRKQAVSLSGFMLFMVYDEADHSFYPQTIGNVAGYKEELGPGEQASGKLLFSIPKCTKGLEFAFPDNPFQVQSSQVRVRLGDVPCS